ncbi:acyltransferase Pun1-like [Lycium barbarum]|uniref:acyltransferase Pun1-like n=1 Tax=Lycium barbarum TaxID=112863 RepID=UPI00293E24C0|nr:acyltransferase Pun1-like [Lycium barbarum]
MGSIAHPLVSIISEKLIKPSSPTSPTKRWHKLSLIDQAFSNSYIPFSLSYTKHQLNNINPTQISQLLEESLSKILSTYYLYAGRLKDNTKVDCNDMGAEFVQVQIDCPISQTLNWHNAAIEDLLFPQGLPWSNCEGRGLVVVQLSYFSCGGIAISMCISHKIGDGCSGYNLFRDWSEITRDPNFTKPSLHYVEQSVFPPPSSGPFIAPLFMSNKHDCVQRRYIFSNEKLLNLKNTVAAESEVQNPTRTEVVSALIFKCAVAAAKANSTFFQPPSMVQAVDLRAQIGLPPNAIGNLLTICPTSITNEENMTISKSVSQMRKSKELAYNRDNVNDNMFVALLLQLAKSKQEYHDNGPNAYQITSLVKFALHDIDFGWGKPTKVSIANGLNNKLAILMGNQSGGLDAFVTLSEQDMSVFERDPELLEFASLVPSC